MQLIGTAGLFDLDSTQCTGTLQIVKIISAHRLKSTIYFAHPHWEIQPIRSLSRQITESACLDHSSAEKPVKKKRMILWTCATSGVFPALVSIGTCIVVFIPGWCLANQRRQSRWRQSDHQKDAWGLSHRWGLPISRHPIRIGKWVNIDQRAWGEK